MSFIDGKHECERCKHRTTDNGWEDITAYSLVVLAGVGAAAIILFLLTHLRLIWN